MQSKMQPHHWESTTLAEMGGIGVHQIKLQVEHFGEAKVKLKN